MSGNLFYRLDSLNMAFKENILIKFGGYVCVQHSCLVIGLEGNVTLLVDNSRGTKPM